MPSLLSGAIGLLCLYRTIASIWTGHGPWWMWLLETIARIGALAARERTVVTAQRRPESPALPSARASRAW